MSTPPPPRSRPSSCLRVLALAAPAMIAACSDAPEPSNPQPPIPGDVCTPAQQRCIDGDPVHQLICRADGRGWVTVDCPAHSSCDTTTGTCVTDVSPCTPGAARCSGSPGTAARQQCSDEGSVWLNQPCESGLVCNPADGTCQPPVCDPGQSRCDGGPADPARSVCADSRLAYVSMPCAEGASCVPTATGSKCVNRICTPGKTQCSPDHLSVLVCDDSGTSQTQAQPCDATQVCMAGACVSSSAPLGGVITCEPGQDLELGPGRYALAVVDTSTGNDLDIAFPASVTGDVVDASVSAHPVTALRRVSCTSLRLARQRPLGASIAQPVPMWPRSDETREFHVPDPDTNGAVVFVRTAKLRAVGQFVNLWEDQTVSPPGALLPDALLDDVLARIDDAVLPRVIVLSGQPTDVDGNGRVDILFTDLLPASSAAAFVFPTRTLFPSPPGDTQVDFGEVAYAQGLNGNLGEAELMAILAHEVQHLIYFGRRLSPYLADPQSVPADIAGDVYAVEGLATMAMAWSGQLHAPPMVAALEDPGEFSLWRLVSPSYLQEPSASFASYGFGALVQQYLAQQSGGFAVQGGGSLVTDQGGAGFVDSFTMGPSGWSRIGPADGRPIAAWYTDFAAALLVDSLGDKVSATTAADPRYRIGSAVPDPVWGGFIGPTLRHEWTVGATGSGPILRRLPWSQRPATLKAGGASFLDLAVGEAGATLSLSGDSARLVVVRYDPGPG